MFCNIYFCYFNTPFLLYNGLRALMEALVSVSLLIQGCSSLQLFHLYSEAFITYVFSTVHFGNETTDRYFAVPK